MPGKNPAAVGPEITAFSENSGIRSLVIKLSVSKPKHIKLILKMRYSVQMKCKPKAMRTQALSCLTLLSKETLEIQFCFLCFDFTLTDREIPIYTLPKIHDQDPYSKFTVQSKKYINIKMNSPSEHKGGLFYFMDENLSYKASHQMATIKKRCSINKF